jgi:TetR/AcrR family transcriptional regulator
VPTEKRSHEERVSQIAEAALRIIGTRGIRELTVSALAGELGISGGALYRHFSSTDAILEAVAERVHGLLIASIPEASLPPWEWLERFVTVRAQTVATHGLGRLMFSDQLAMALPAAAQQRLREAVRSTLEALEACLRRGQEAGLMRTDVAPSDLLPIIAGTVQMIAHAQGGGPLQKVTTPARAFRTLRILLGPALGPPPEGGSS